MRLRAVVQIKLEISDQIALGKCAQRASGADGLMNRGHGSHQPAPFVIKHVESLQRVLAWRPDARSAVYRLAPGGAIAAPEALPSSSEADVPVRWSADGRGILVYRPGQVPAQVDRIDLATGRREMVRTMAPPDRTGLVSLDPVLMTPDHASYAYTYIRVLSTLFTVEGVK